MGRLFMPSRFSLAAFLLLGGLACKAQAAGLPGDSSWERSLSVGYGPDDLFHVGFNRGPWGAYAYPFLSTSKEDYSSASVYSLRLGGLYSYTAFTYRQLECRAQIGAGVHGSIKELTVSYQRGNTRRRGAGG